MKKQIFKLFIGLLIFSSCSDMLDTDPSNLLVRDEFWKSEADVEASVIGVYNEMQSTVDEMIVWGDSRCGYLEYSDVSGSILGFHRHHVTERNSYTSWGDMYQTVNFANTIIKFAPDVMSVDDQYTQESLNNHLGECHYIRALMHFYMIRTFLEIPYISEAYDNDTQDFYVDLTPRDSVFMFIEEDLLKAKSLINKTWDDAYNQKGRISQNAIEATLADVYLWMGEYDKALNACDAVKGLGLETKENWYDMFAEGNNETESIFEIQFSQEFKDVMPTGIWNDIYGKTKLNQEQKLLWPNFDASVDIRVPGTFVRNGSKSTDPLMLWKFLGLVSGGDYGEDKKPYRETNWIVYRYADVLLMKAEALNNLSRGKDALVELNKILERAGVSQLDIDDPQGQEMDELILDERGREFAFEGKRWFDLVRVALRYGDMEDRANKGNQILINRVVGIEGDDTSGDPIKFIDLYKLLDPLGWFLPINYGELAANPQLRQFPYYDRSF
ncbi:RagB/SusD family nutrient uptake outer membrane protein [Puteibacter caeruleilacunae]|nr:RagB/SusD family nutrient uptake outer membrane protein [Puteibacter caeruleilacunae]